MGNGAARGRRRSSRSSGATGATGQARAIRVGAPAWHGAERPAVDRGLPWPQRDSDCCLDCSRWCLRRKAPRKTRVCRAWNASLPEALSASGRIPARRGSHLAGSGQVGSGPTGPHSEIPLRRKGRSRTRSKRVPVAAVAYRRTAACRLARTNCPERRRLVTALRERNRGSAPPALRRWSCQYATGGLMLDCRLSPSVVRVGCQPPYCGAGQGRPLHVLLWRQS